MRRLKFLVGYDQSMNYNNRILYVIVMCNILVAGFYLTLYIIKIKFTPAIITHTIYMMMNLTLYIALKLKRFTFVKFTVVIIHMIQLTLAVYLWFPVETGYNIFYFMVPLAAFLVMDYDDRIQRKFAVVTSVISAILYFFSEAFEFSFYLYETTGQMNRLLASSSVLSMFIPLTYIFLRFAYDRFTTHQELHSIANTDYLTRTSNRKVLFEMGKAAINRGHQEAYDFCLLVLDIDHFKSINDQYGHPVGDELLKQISSLISSRVRKTDTFSRFGGEEFAVLFEGVDLRRAAMIAEELMKSIRTYEFKLNDIVLSMTVSMGLVQYKTDYKDFKDMMKAADDALYEAKNSGRNRIIIGK